MFLYLQLFYLFYCASIWCDLTVSYRFFDLIWSVDPLVVFLNVVLGFPGVSVLAPQIICFLSDVSFALVFHMMSMGPKIFSSKRFCLFRAPYLLKSFHIWRNSTFSGSNNETRPKFEKFSSRVLVLVKITSILWLWSSRRWFESNNVDNSKLSGLFLRYNILFLLPQRPANSTFNLNNVTLNREDLLLHYFAWLICYIR